MPFLICWLNLSIDTLYLAFSYCGDHISDYNVVYLQGTNGEFANMDIDCDGRQGGPADDGRCGSSGDTQSMTSFMDTVASYGKGISDLDANVHPYVVFGNEGTKAGWKTFNPQSYGIEPLSVMAVVCNNQLVCLVCLAFGRYSNLNDTRSTAFGATKTAMTATTQ